VLHRRGLKVIAAALLCAAAFQLCAAPPESPSPARPKIGLVLSGGGARGIAHIGVLKVLHESRIPIDFIVATSIGSLVGGAYAAGRTTEEMEALLGSADWARMFSDRPPRQDLSLRRKEDDLRFIGKFELGIKREGLVLPRGALGTQNLEEFLRLVSRPAGGAGVLDDLPILFRAVATDLVSGEQVILRDVPLTVAMRASMSVPGAFAPTRVAGRMLGDGGLVRNLPVEVALDMGADVIIAVNVGTPLLAREALSSALGVAQQMVNILSEQNVAISLKALRPGDILISPDLGGVTFVDFERAAELIARGETAARQVAARLGALALDERDYARWETARTRIAVLPDLRIREVRVEGAVRTNPEALKREVRERAGVESDRIVRDEQLIQAGRILHGTGEFERVDVRAEIRDGRRLVIIDVDEKPWGPDYLRIGGRAVSDFRTDSRFSVTLQHTRTWLNAWGAEWRNEVQAGDVRRFTTSLYQPLGAGSPWFVEPVLQTVESNFDIFGPGNRRTDRITTATSSASAALGRRLGGVGVVRLGAGYERYRSKPLISSQLTDTVEDSGKYLRLSASFDALDDADFPRSGYLVSAGTTTIRYSSGGGDPVQTYVIEGLVPVTWGRFTLAGLAAGGRSSEDRVGFSLGGFLNLSGTPAGAVTGSQAALAAALAYYRVGELPRGIGGNWYAGLSLEAGNAWQRRSDVDFGDLQKATSIFLALDTIIGPLYLAWGHTFGGDSAFYLFLGRPTERI
jgi:NTE family protein